LKRENHPEAGIGHRPDQRCAGNLQPGFSG
jgi:hypothetical protein